MDFTIYADRVDTIINNIEGMIAEEAGGILSPGEGLELARAKRDLLAMLLEIKQGYESKKEGI